MIRETTANAAIILAQEFDTRRLVLEAQPGTPLAELNQQFQLSQNDLTDSKEYTPDAAYVAGVSSNWGGQLRGEEIPHSTTLDNIADTIATFVQSHLKFAKTVVKPVIVQLAEEVTKDIASIEVDPYKDIQIVQYDLPKPLQDPSLQEAINKFKDAVAIPELKYMVFGEKSVGEILELAMSGSSSDDLIKEWLAVKGEAFIQMVWDSVFTNQPTEQDFASLKNGKDGLDVCLLVYLLANKLHDSPPEGLNMSMGNFNVMLLEFKQQAAMKLAYAMDEYAAFVKTQLLIKNYNPKQITVIGEVYRNWLAADGNQAFVLASTLLEQPALYLPLIQERKAELQKRWDRHVAMVSTTEMNKRFIKCREFLKLRAVRVVQDNFQECYSNLREDGAVDGNLPEFLAFKQKLEEFVLTLTDKDFDNIWEVSRRVICECVFFYTDSGKILSGIEAACEKNPNLPVNEAAFLSLITYVTDWVCDQMTIKGV